MVLRARGLSGATTRHFVHRPAQSLHLVGRSAAEGLAISVARAVPHLFEILLTLPGCEPGL